MATKHRESPMRRVTPNGRVVWLARYTTPEGERAYWKPEWNGGRSTFRRKAEAQQAIDEAHAAHERTRPGHTVGAYFDTWLSRHPRFGRTEESYRSRAATVLDTPIAGRELGDWPFADLRRRHAYELVDHLFRDRGRAATGVTGVLRVLSAMAEDAITDEVAETNFVRGVKVKANDPRCTKPKRPVRVFSFEAMHFFAACGGPHEPMLRTFTDTGMRLGEVLPLERGDLDSEKFQVRRTAHAGRVYEGTKTTHGDAAPGRRVPCPPTLAKKIAAAPAQINTRLLFPTEGGRLWQAANWYRDVWYPTRETAATRAAKRKLAFAAELATIRPHECRHSFISLMLAEGVDPAELAEITGATVLTMMRHYNHAVSDSHARVKELVG